MIAQGISLSKYDKYKWVVNTPEGRNILVNDSTAQLINILIQAENLEVALETFNKVFEANLSESKFLEVIKTKLYGFNILTGDNSVYKKRKYLWLNIQFINSSFAGILGYPFKFLYKREIFWYILFLTSVFNIFFVAKYFSFHEIINPETNYLLFLILVYISMFIHEFGHIAACKQFNIKHGGIGFGFYFTFPVLYADITNVWTNSKEKRIICNLGGISNELVYSAVLGILYLFTQQKAFLLASTTVSIKAITELNPFARYDGYWILSDLVSIPNLLFKSKIYLKELLSLRSENSIWKGKNHFTARELFLFFYGFVNTSFIFIYSAIIISFYFIPLINFPVKLWEIVTKTFQMTLTLQDFNVDFFLVFSVYFLMVRLVILYMIRLIKPSSNG